MFTGRDVSKKTKTKSLKELFEEGEGELSACDLSQSLTAIYVSGHFCNSPMFYFCFQKTCSCLSVGTMFFQPAKTLKLTYIYPDSIDRLVNPSKSILKVFFVIATHIFFPFSSHCMDLIRNGTSGNSHHQADYRFSWKSRIVIRVFYF